MKKTPKQDKMPANEKTRLAQTQRQVDQVVDIMKNNMDRVLERDTKLSDLDTRADALQLESQQFEKTSAAVKNKYWWENMKMWIILAVVVLVLIGVIVIISLV